MKISQINVPILENIHIALNYYMLKISAEEITRVIVPGQFLNIKVTNTYDPLLKRPFSPFLIDRKDSTISIFYKVVGKGTKILSALKKGDLLSISGPCGNAFEIPKNTKKVAIVGRGVGIAPLVFLSQILYEREIEIFAFLSIGKGDFIVGKRELQDFGAEIYYTTSNSELVTDKLWELLKSETEIDAIYTCGSRRLRREVAKMSKEYGILSQVSLEEVMGCGIGVCMGCTVKIGTPTNWQYKRVCIEGPVFNACEIVDE